MDSHRSRPTDTVPGPHTQPELPPLADLSPRLREWDRYRIVGRLGSGGMGEVFRAWDPRLQRWVALKFLQGSEPALVERFQREAQAQARVDHPRVCRVYEVGEVDGRPYIAMQEIAGGTLDEVAVGLSLEERVRLVAEAAEAVHAAHRIGLIHRDLKPRNVLVERGEDGLTPFVVDFGLAREQHATSLTLTGTLSGTPGYMAPEQARGEEVDRRSDVYSLGALLYELTAGRLPFPASSYAEAFAQLLEGELTPPRKLVPSLPADLETVILRCLERDPARRYDSARALAEDLRRWLDGEPVLARRSGAGYRLRKRVVKYPRTAAAAALAAFLVLALLAVAVQARWQAAARADAAQRFANRAKEMESLLRVAELAPEHATSRERATVRQAMAEVEQEIARHGRWARGPGEHALGRGALALGDAAGALVHLQRARRAGESSPELSYALGQALGQMYVEGLRRLAPERDPQAFALRREELARRYRDPARAHLRRASRRAATLDTPELMRAWLALYEGEWELARAEAERALAGRPWLHEARTLQGQAWREQGDRAAERGEMEAALAAYQRAAAPLVAAVAIGRSAASAQVEECGRQRSLLRLARLSRPLELAEVEDAVAACRRATRLHPGLARAWGEEGLVWQAWAEEQLRAGEDPSAAVRQALAALSRDARLDPAAAEPWTHIGAAHNVSARWLMQRGEDPGPSLEQGVEALRRAVRLQAGQSATLNILGNTLLVRARHLEGRGAPGADASRREAISSLQRAVTLVPSYAVAWGNLGQAWVDTASGRNAAGEDPLPALREGIAAFDRALAINASHPAVHNNRGNAELTLAEHLLSRGEDPRPALGEAAASYRAALALRPEYATPQWNLAYAARLEGQWLLRTGEDPSGALDRAAVALAESRRLNPSDADNALEAARRELLRARWEVSRGADPRPALARASREVEAGLALNPASAELHLAAAERWRLEVELASAPGQAADASAATSRGLVALERALALNPRLASALALRAELLRARGDAAGAATALAAARAINPNAAPP